MQKKPSKDQVKGGSKTARGKSAIGDLTPSVKQAKEIKGGTSNLNLSKSNIN